MMQLDRAAQEHQSLAYSIPLIVWQPLFSLPKNWFRLLPIAGEFRWMGVLANTRCLGDLRYTCSPLEYFMEGLTFFIFSARLHLHVAKVMSQMRFLIGTVSSKKETIV